MLTLASPKGTLWRIPLAEGLVDATAGALVALTTAGGIAPQFGAGYLLYVSSTERRDSIWKLADGAATELWSAPSSPIIGGPDVDADGRRIAFSVERDGKTSLYAMNADGTDARVVTASLALRGFPAWAPDGRSLLSAGTVNEAPLLFRVSLDGATTPFVRDYAIDPVWSRDGSFVCLLRSGHWNDISAEGSRRRRRRLRAA